MLVRNVTAGRDERRRNGLMYGAGGGGRRVELAGGRAKDMVRGGSGSRRRSGVRTARGRAGCFSGKPADEKC